MYKRNYYWKNKETISEHRKMIRELRSDEEIDKINEILSLPPKTRKYFIDWSFVLEGTCHIDKRLNMSKYTNIIR